MPKAFGILLESELHGGELNQGVGCDLMGMRGPGREGEHSSPRSHAGSAPGASSHPSPGQASPLGAAQRDFTPGAPPEGCMDGAAPGLAPSALRLCTLHPWAGDMPSLVDQVGPSLFRCFGQNDPSLAHTHGNYASGVTPESGAERCRVGVGWL